MFANTNRRQQENVVPKSSSQLFDKHHLHRQQQYHSLEMSEKRPHSRSEDPFYLRNLPLRPHHPLAATSRPRPRPQSQSQSQPQLQTSSPLGHQLAYPTTYQGLGKAQHPLDTAKHTKHTDNNDPDPDHDPDPDIDIDFDINVQQETPYTYSQRTLNPFIVRSRTRTTRLN